MENASAPTLMFQPTGSFSEEDAKQLHKEFSEILDRDPSARLFVFQYVRYIHAVDDLIDGDIKGPEAVLKISNSATEVYSNDFYRRNAHLLFIIDTLINNTYADSVQWGGSLHIHEGRHPPGYRHQWLSETGSPP